MPPRAIADCKPRGRVPVNAQCAEGDRVAHATSEMFDNLVRTPGGVSITVLGEE